MKVVVTEITGYASAICALYMTNRNLDEARMKDIYDTVEIATDRFGFVKPAHQWCEGSLHWREKFMEYMDKTITYGIKSGHWQILKFIDIHIYMEGLHRGAQDDYDAHAKRLEIIRSTTRTMKGAKHPEFSEFYRDKVMTFKDVAESGGIELPDEFTDGTGTVWVKGTWGYVKKEFEKNPDVWRGLTGLGMASNNISKVPYGEHLQHIYDERREGGHANPELQQAMEDMRTDLTKKCKPLGTYLGKVWVESGGGHWEEKNQTYLVSKLDK